MSWQPIETAPKDGTRILAYQPLGMWHSARPWRGERIEVVYWHQPANPKAEGLWVPSHRPTHWMPLPDPPRGRMTATEKELRECLSRLVDRVGAGHLQTAYPNLWRRISAALAQTEGS